MVGDVAKAVVKDQGGPLGVDGNFDLKPDGMYQLKGNLSVKDAKDRMLLPVIRMLGRQGQDGKVNLNYSGRLPMLAAKPAEK